MLLMVFGAGASFDAVPAYALHTGRDHPHRVPLTNDLFDLRYEDKLAKFRRAAPIIPLLRDLESGGSLEAVMEDLQAEAAGYPERVRQLLAVRYYLHLMLSDVDRRWYDASGGVTNYLHILDEVRRLIPSEEEVAIVTFNYDRLIEWALDDMGEPVGAMDRYVTGRFKVFKLHGSVNWGRVVVKYPTVPEALTGWRLIEHFIATAPDVQVGAEYQVAAERPVWGAKGDPLVPAIAVPLQRKQDFELPRGHLDELKRLVPQVDRLVSIGWRANDAPFLELLKDGLLGRIRGLVVSNKQPEDVVGRFLAAGIDADLAAHSGGFTRFVLSRQIVDFLRA